MRRCLVFWVTGVRLAPPIVLLPVAVVMTLIRFVPMLLTTPLCPLSLLPLPGIISISLSIDSAVVLIVSAAITTIDRFATSCKSCEIGDITTERDARTQVVNYPSLQRVLEPVDDAPCMSMA